MPVASGILMDEKPNALVPARPPYVCLAGGAPQTPAKGELLPFGFPSRTTLAMLFSYQ